MAGASICRRAAPWLLLGLGAAPTLAADLQELQPLDFGRLALRGNEAVSTLLLRHRGQPPAQIGGAAQWLLIEPGQPGRYRLDELPPLTEIEIEVIASDDFTVGGQGAGERIHIDSFSFDPLRSDGSGAAELRLGGRLHTSGSGELPAEGLYRAAVEIELRYRSPPSQAEVSRRFGVFAQFELRNTVMAEQLQALDFGLLSALPAADAQARLRLSPSGQLNGTAGAPARLLALGGVSAGRIRVSGAAAGQLLEVKFEPPSIELCHPNPASACFEVSDFTTSPQGLAFKSDAQGVLEFNVGATLSTTHTDHAYDEGAYRGHVSVEINY